MELEQQVTSLELSKKLKKLGVEQESLFVWQEIYTDFIGKNKICLLLKGENQTDFIASAFTVAELGEMLPWRSKRMGTVNNAELVFTKLANIEGKSLWNVAYWDEDKDLYLGMVVRIENEDTEANARAKMLIYLKENKLI